MAARNKRKAPTRKKRRRWIIPKLLLLIGTGGLIAFLFAIFVMQQELHRIGFFTKTERPSFQLPSFSTGDKQTPAANAPLSPPSRIEPSPPETRQPSTQSTSQSARVSDPNRTAEELSREERKRMQALTSSSSSHSPEELSHDDRKGLEDVLRSR